MEDLLLQIVNECSNNKHAGLKSSAQAAYDTLQSQQSLLRSPAHELRAKCLGVFQTALETKKSKFVALAVTGFHRILRDDRFQTNFEPEDDSLWLPSQFLQAISSIMSQSDDTQVDLLKVLLNIACSSYWTVNGRIIIQMLAACCDVYEFGTAAVKTASQAAANQTLRSFCHLLDLESQEAKDNKMHEVGSGGIDCFNELIPILQYICSKLDEAQSGQNTTALLLLEGLHTVVSSLPQRVHTNTHFTKFLWQKLCPVLIGLMASPRNNNTGFSRIQQNDSLPQQKIIYSIAGQLVRLVGFVGSLRPVLESVYHRMLLYPRSNQRLDSLKALTELLKSPSRLVDFAGPLLVESEKGCQQSDMALTRLVMDSLQECSESKDPVLVSTSISCVETLLSTLLVITNGQAINHVYVNKINSLYTNLPSCDYKGPLTYQTLSRLPKVYTDSVGVSEKLETSDEKEDDTSSESSNCSGETEENNQYSDVDENEYASKIGFPESLGCIQKQKIYSTDIGNCSRDNARHFIENLLDFLPTLQSLKYSIEIDDAIQKFASNYCKGSYYKNTTKFENTSSIVNADGIYLATYSALSLNLKLTNEGFYDSKSDNIPMTEDQFVSEVEESGVLVYLSSYWLCEVYQQVLNIDLLSTTGCILNVSIVNLLSGGIYFETEVLSYCAKLEKAKSQLQISVEAQAGIKLVRRILTCCWDSILAVLTAGVKSDSATVPLSLHALHNLALLCNVTCLQKRSGIVFSLLSNACCNFKDEKPVLLASHALSLNVLLSRALELASHAPQSWPHVLKCCLYVSRLEHMLAFTTPIKTGKNENLENFTSESDLAALINDTSAISPLPPTTVFNVVTILSFHIDRLFEDAAVKLKLNSLLSFCSSVCAASEKQLRFTNSKNNQKPNWSWLLKSNQSTPPPPLLLSRLAQLLIKSARSGRPMIHIMKLWSAVGPHLMHASSHKDPTISKLAVTCIHDVMTTLLNENTELEYFHFNEALFKPFETLLCLELCDTDVVNSICEFVEGSQAEIRSGWRPLFRALGGVSTSNHINSLLEVFQIFLNTNSPLVFANAAMDFIQCLIKHVRGNYVEEEKIEDCKSVLSFVEKCSQMLCMMHSMASCPQFNTSRRLSERIQDSDFHDIKDEGDALAVWAELLEGLAPVVPLCPLSYQPLILDMIFSILTETLTKPDNDKLEKGTIMLKTLIDAVVECIAIPIESVARLGCACLRHIVLTNVILTPEQWNIIIDGIEKSALFTLNPIMTLNSAYSRYSHQYYGDQAHIKVAARKDSSVQRNARLKHIAQQVFLLESQRCELSLSHEDDDEDERSYVLLIYEDSNSNTTKDCVPLSNLLVSLLAHQMLLQTIGTILLQGTEHVIPSIAGVISNQSEDRILLKLPENVVERLLGVLIQSYNTSVEFDSRPGLKFLLQKVAQLNRAANLYRQAGAACTISLLTVFDLCSNVKEFLPKLKENLDLLSSTYIDILIDKDGKHSAVDNINETITFIIAQTDELEINSNKEKDEEIEPEEDKVIEEVENPEIFDVEQNILVNEIEKQKCESICKDREAHMCVWAEMLVSALELLCQLENEKLITLLPAVFPTVHTLIAQATHTTLKQQLAKLFNKIGNAYAFNTDTFINAT